MIKSFASRRARDVFDSQKTRYARELPQELHRKAWHKLDQLDSATNIDDLKAPPSNKLSKLQGDLSGYWRVKIDKQWAVIFHWHDGCALDVDIIDYH